jgi:hypothetical protein
MGSDPRTEPQRPLFCADRWYLRGRA